MHKLGFLVRIETKPEYADQVAALLTDALELAKQEEQTLTWFAFRESPTVFGIFDTFPDEGGRTAHFNGEIATVLKKAGPKMFATTPVVARTEILAAKLP